MHVPYRIDATQYDTLDDAWQASALNFKAQLVPHMYFHPVTGDVVHNANSNTVLTDRGDRIADHVGARYRIIQPRDWADPLFKLHDAGAIEVVAIGGFKGGRQFFVQARYNGTFEPREGDKVEPLVTFLGSMDGSTSNKAGETYQRIICRNTFIAAMRDLDRSVRHTGDVELKTAAVETAIAGVVESHQRFKETATAMAQASITAPVFAELVDRVFPMPKAGSRTGKMENIRSKVGELFTSGKGNTGETLWDAFNAVTEWSTHYASTRSGEEGRTHSAWLGSNARRNQQAWDFLRASL